MVNVLLVFVGGGFGAVCRYLAGVGYGRAFGLDRPYLATFAVNVMGGLLMGALVGGLTSLGVRGLGQSERLRLLLGVGVLGGFTTFSSFSLETVRLLERKAYGTSAAYVCASVLLSVLGVMLGLMLTRRSLA